MTKNNKTYCFDIDGTICTITDANYSKAEPYLERVKHINQLYEDGNTIVFIAHKNSITQLYTMNIDGSNLKNLSQNKARDWNAKVYPDNKKIVFMSDRDENWEIYIMNFDGSNQINLSNNPRTDFSFSFLPLPN